MIKLGKIIEIIKDPVQIVPKLGHRGLMNMVSDEKYLKLLYYSQFKKRLNLENPKTYNEKLQWLKLYDRNPLYTKLVDKYEVRQYVKEKIGEDYLIPLLGIWNKTEEIDWTSLPNQFVLKPTHDSGTLVICKDKSNLDLSSTTLKLNKSLSRNYYYSSREWAYKDVQPRVIAEKYMLDDQTDELRDYKFFCFDGEVKAMFIATDRGKGTRFDFYDPEFNHMPFTQNYPNATKNIKKPILFDRMKEIASSLSTNIPHVRVDLYEVNGKIYFGEMTLFHFSGLIEFVPSSYDELFGSWIELPNKNFS